MECQKALYDNLLIGQGVKVVPLSDDMYYSKSNAVPAEIIVSKSSKKFRISKSIKTFEMKKDFIARLDHKGYSEIFIPYHLIKECLHELLDKESQAIIWMSIYQKRFENVKFSKGVKSKAKEIDKLHRSSKARRLRKAFENLVNIIIEQQGA